MSHGLCGFLEKKMRAWRNALFFALSVFLASGSATAGPTGDGLTFCGSPSPAPHCVETPDAYRDDDHLKACQQEVSHYVETVAAYRTCLLQEYQRAVVEMNSLVDRFKCGAREKNPCK
jgi:hypothetical protein